MFKDLKEYQEITQLYYNSVNVSEEQREFNRRLDEQEFTEEEALYVIENIDEISAAVISDLREEFQVLSEETLTEEDYLDLQEVLGSALVSGIGRKITTKLARKAGPAIRKGLKTMKTGAKDVLRGGGEVAKGAFKKVKGAVTSKTGKRILGGLGALTGVGLVGGLVNNLRKKGKESRLKDEKKNQTEVKPPVQIGGGNAGGSTDSGGTAGGGKQETKPPKQTETKPEPPKQTETKPDKPDTKAEVKPETKQKKMHPIEKKNRARFGDAHVDKLKNKQKDFKAMKKGEMSKADFIKAYPKSITAQKAAGLRDHTEWDAYDKVLEYLFSTDQVDTIEEANYVMMEMDQETIGSIVYEVNEFLEEGFIDNLKAGVSKVKTSASNLGDKIKKKASNVISKVKNKVDVAQKTLNPASKENKKIREKQAIQKDDSATTSEKQTAKAQEMAYKRKRSNKSIADIKAENKAKMIANAKKRNEKFQKDKMKK